MELFTAQQIQSLNELELLVYRYINERPNTVPFMRIRELAAEAHVSTTTVLHFCKKMGCDGYAQFKWKLKEQAGTNQETHLPDTLNELQNFLWRVGTPEYDAALDEAAGLIARAERVFLVGIGNSGSMAEYGARYLSNLGKFALSVTDPFYPVTVTPNVTMTAVLLSVSGETVQILHLAHIVEVEDVVLVGELAALLGLGRALDVLVGNEVVEDDGDVLFVEHAVEARLFELVDGDGGGDVIAQHDVELGVDELACLDLGEACVCGQNFLRLGHSHGSFSF